MILAYGDLDIPTLLGKEQSGLLTKTSELREREVVNILDGRRLGLATDLEIEMETGKIKAIVIPGPGKFLWLFGKSEDFVIPWERIRKVGVDVILVEAPNYVEEKASVINIGSD